MNMKKIILTVLAIASTISVMATQTAAVRITLSGSNATYSKSTLKLFEDDARTAAAEDGYDSPCMLSQANSNSTLIYGLIGGAEYSTVSTNDLRGLEIGFKTNNIDTDYKLQFSNFDGMEFYLYDRVLHKMTLINSTTPDYNFTATAGQVAVNDRFVINTVAVIGTESAWWESEYNSILTIAANGETATGTITFPAGKVGEWYNFKVVGRTAANWYSNGAEFTSTNNSQQVNATESDNMYFEIAEEGEYTFTWTFATNTLEITFPAAPVPTCTSVRTGMVVDNYYTICLPKAVTAANGASFWNMSNRGAGVAYLEEAVLPLVAGRPYIIQAEDAELCVEYSGDEVAAGAYGALHGTLEPMDQAALNAAGSDIYLLKNNELRLVSDQSGNSLAANRAYIKYGDFVVSTPNPAPGRRVRAIPMQDQSTTGVENLNAAEAPVKTVIDGKMYILRGEHMFDATGRMVK